MFFADITISSRKGLELNESGEKLADALAKEIDTEIDNLTSHQEGGHHA